MAAVGVYEEEQMNDVIIHYDRLIDEDNDPFRDPPPLREYMDKWDGADFISALALKKNDSVLEIGIGTGRLAAKTAPLCASLTGIDISPKTIRRAEENLLYLENVQLICGDFLQYSFVQSFDVIYSSLTFMHFEDKYMAVSKAAALLSDGGRFVLSVDKDNSGFIDMGNYRLTTYPDSPENIARCAERCGTLKLKQELETELAHILVFEKRH